jgi:hypothetical protein
MAPTIESVAVRAPSRCDRPVRHSLAKSNKKYNVLKSDQSRVFDGNCRSDKVELRGCIKTPTGDTSGGHQAQRIGSQYGVARYLSSFGWLLGTISATRSSIKREFSAPATALIDSDGLLLLITRMSRATANACYLKLTGERVAELCRTRGACRSKNVVLTVGRRMLAA